ncbi:MAG: hypothetical protein M1831_005846 [Alyxoria varia]|nr:MAG: hypothetical protein M1831_005846 [Alyxoria varia]
MATKRSRAAYEADSQPQQAEFATYGTPLPPLDPDVRDDGSYVPIWKQEVTDDRGRKRLHGAFTGGFSAGYFNTVGSKEGWTPSTFVSSRTKRHKDHDQRKDQNLDDFMDEEDRADAANAQHLQTNQGFSGFGSTDEDSKRKGLIMDLLKPQGETMGVKLLSKMGWRHGQGLGPKIWRRPNLDEDNVGDDADRQNHLFAPQNSPMLTFARKDDRKGLGFQAEPQLQRDSPPSKDQHSSGSDDVDFARSSSSKLNPQLKQKHKSKPAGFGVGVLNHDSENENEYELGPQISYTKSIGSDKKTKKVQQKAHTSSKAANPLLKSKPVFKPKKSLTAGGGFRKCHDGRLPLDGFVLGKPVDLSSNSKDFEQKHAPPTIPNDWISSKTQEPSVTQTSEYQSAADIAKSTTLDPKGRAAILGESQLPGKSVFDYVSQASRDRLASATGKSNLPSGLGEQLPGFSSQSKRNPSAELPYVEKEIAVAALGRGVGGWMPYADDQAKRDRYTAFLEYHGGMRSHRPQRPTGTQQDQWLQELKEFAHAAEVFKPMTGSMASRFTSSSSTMKPPNEARTEQTELPSASASKAEDSAETAAKLGMFGLMTRSVKQFYPSHLLCKRFNVKQPSHAQDSEKTGTHEAGQPSKQRTAAEAASERPMQELSIEDNPDTTPLVRSQQDLSQQDKPINTLDVAVDSSKNEALEAERAGDAVFKAIFGSDDDDSE